jgi:ABC-type sugar transport system permease subunit
MTPGGGPLNSTMLLVVYIYQQAFTNGRMGRGSAAALVLFAIVFILTIIQKSISRKTVHYD